MKNIVVLINRGRSHKERAITMPNEELAKRTYNWLRHNGEDVTYVSEEEYKTLQHVDELLVEEAFKDMLALKVRGRLLRNFFINSNIYRVAGLQKFTQAEILREPGVGYVVAALVARRLRELKVPWLREVGISLEPAPFERRVFRE